MGDTKALFENWTSFKTLRNATNKALEEARNAKLIGKPAEAALTLYLTPEQEQVVTSLNQDIRVLLLVSQLHFANAADAPADVIEYDGYKIQVAHAVGEVSPRDRMYHTDLGTDKDFPMLSAHEAEIVREYFPEALTEGLE